MNHAPTVFGAEIGKERHDTGELQVLDLGLLYKSLPNQGRWPTMALHGGRRVDFEWDYPRFK